MLQMFLNIYEVIVMKNIEKEIISNEEFDLIFEYIKLRNELNISQSELARRVG